MLDYQCGRGRREHIADDAGALDENRHRVWRSETLEETRPDAGTD